MRESMARAAVGDDVLDGDPTVGRLEAQVAELLGKERALFFPSGVMANQTAIQIWTDPATEVVVEASAHVLDWEDGAPAQWAGVQLRPVATPDGVMSAEAVGRALRPPSGYRPRTSLVCLENTHNAAGGRVVPLESTDAIRELTRERGLPVHLDGARLWNASAATGVEPARYAARADSVMVTLSKGLGCPVGSVLAGPSEALERGWRIRRRLGGAMRQSGVLAAAALYALDHHRQRLVEDHENATLLAELAGGVAGLDVVEPETNIVMIDIVRDDLDAAAVLERLAAKGVRMSRFGPQRLRAVTHLDVDDAAIRRAAEALAAVMERS